jgi:hypothetical protein
MPVFRNVLQNTPIDLIDKRFVEDSEKKCILPIDFDLLKQSAPDEIQKLKCKNGKSIGENMDVTGDETKYSSLVRIKFISVLRAARTCSHRFKCLLSFVHLQPSTDEYCG